MTLEDCCSKVLSKAADTTKTKPKEANTLILRSIRLNALLLSKPAKEKIDLKACKRRIVPLFASGCMWPINQLGKERIE